MEERSQDPIFTIHWFICIIQTNPSLQWLQWITILMLNTAAVTSLHCRRSLVCKNLNFAPEKKYCLLKLDEGVCPIKIEEIILPGHKQLDENKSSFFFILQNFFHFLNELFNNCEVKPGKMFPRF